MIFFCIHTPGLDRDPSRWFPQTNWPTTSWVAHFSQLLDGVAVVEVLGKPPAIVEKCFKDQEELQVDVK